MCHCNKFIGHIDFSGDSLGEDAINKRREEQEIRKGKILGIDKDIEIEPENRGIDEN